MNLDTIRKFLSPRDYDVEGTEAGWAVFTTDRRRRLALGRAWTPELGDVGGRLAIFVGLNPSIAGAFASDQTITKEIGFAKRLKCTALLKVNLYPWISTDPAGLDRPEATIDVRDRALREIVTAAIGGPFVCIAAWGSHPKATPERIAEVSRLLPGPLHCFGVTKDGSPRHTSRIAYATPVEVWP